MSECHILPLAQQHSHIIEHPSSIPHFNMAGIANKPLAIFRRPESPKPLHSRWGDVSISVPTDGSWNQYNNPHRPAQRKQTYGPGFVPDYPSTGRKSRPVREEEINEDMERAPVNKTSVSRRNSLSLGALKPGRLSVRLASRPKKLTGELPVERTTVQPDHKQASYAYKPIHQDYSAEVTEKSSRANAPQYRYIPRNRQYPEDIPISPRSQSARPYHSSRSRRDSFTDSIDSTEHSRDYASSRRGSHPEDDRRSLRSSLGDSSDSSSSRLSYGLPTRRRASIVPDRKRASSLKPMTLAMVPDPEELYE